MQSPAMQPLPGAHIEAAKNAKAAEVAILLVAEMRSWASGRPEFSEPLADCIEELSWAAKLGPAAVPESAVRERHDTFTFSTKRIITVLKCSAELYPSFARILLCCVSEIEEIERHRVPACPRERTRDVVFEAIGQGYGTGPAIAEATGLNGWRVRHALRRLHSLGLIRSVGCGAVSFEDGNRTRLWELVPSLELKGPRYAAA